MTTPRFRLLALIALMAPAGCASSEPTYYTLAAQPGAPIGGGPRVVALRRIGVAGYLDRKELVRGADGTQVRISETQRWAEPLDALATRILAQDLTQRMPGSTVFSDAGAIAAKPDATVEIDIQRFDSAPDGTVTLMAQIAVSRSLGEDFRPPVATRAIQLNAQSGGRGADRMTAAMSRLLGRLADVVGGMLRGV